MEQCSDLWHQCQVAVEYHAAAILLLKVKSHASEYAVPMVLLPIEIDTTPGTVFAGNRAEAHLHSEWNRQEHCVCQKSNQDGAEALCHCYPAHGRALSQQVRSGFPRCIPSAACTAGRGHQVVRARDRCRAQGRLRLVHQVLACLWQEASACLAGNDVHTVAGEGCAFHPAAAQVASPGPAAETTSTRKTPRPSAKTTSPRTVCGKRFSTIGGEVEKSALRPRLGATSVH